MIEILFKKLDENALIPTRKHEGDAGYDLKAVSCKYDPIYDRYIYGLGFATKIPLGYEAEVRPRSGNTKTEAYIPNAPGTIDSNYTGEWKVIYKLRTPIQELFPDGVDDLAILEMENEYIPYKEGDLIAQVLFHKTEDAKFSTVDELPSTDRGVDGGVNRTDTNFKS